MEKRGILEFLGWTDRWAIHPGDGEPQPIDLAAAFWAVALSMGESRVRMDVAPDQFTLLIDERSKFILHHGGEGEGCYIMDGLADRIRRQAGLEHNARLGQQAAERELADIRAARAASHILTGRQAKALASVRAERSPFHVPWPWKSTDGKRHWRFSPCSRSGGAVTRMLGGLIDEGLLTQSRKLTPAGLARLEAWEITHGVIAPLNEVTSQ